VTNADSLLHLLEVMPNQVRLHANAYYFPELVIDKPALKGFEIEEITAKNIDERRYPGSTHLLRKDGDAHVIQVIQLREVVDLIRSGRIILPSAL
jgi:hypothetical protein